MKTYYDEIFALEKSKMIDSIPEREHLKKSNEKNKKVVKPKKIILKKQSQKMLKMKIIKKDLL